MILERIKVTASRAKDIFCDGKHMAPTYIVKKPFFNQKPERANTGFTIW